MCIRDRSTKLWHFYALAAFYGTGSMTLAGISITCLLYTSRCV